MADEDGRRKPGESEVHRRKRGKNVALALALVAFIVVVYIVAVVRMGG
jgi:hypothetical protein